MRNLFAKQIHKTLRSSIYILTGLAFFFGCHTASDDHPRYFDSLFKAADTSSPSGLQKIHTALDEAITNYPTGDGDKAKYYQLKAAYHFNNRDFEKSIAADDSVIAIAAKRKEEERFGFFYISALAHKGDNYAAMRRFDEALNAYTRAKLNSKNYYADSCAIAIYNSRIANILYAVGRFQEAAEYFKQSFEMYQPCSADRFDHVAQMQVNIDNTGLAYFEAGKLDSAEYYYKKADTFILNNWKRFPEKISYLQLARGVIEGNIGQVREKQGKYNEAIPLLKQSISTTQQDDPYYAIAPRIALARIFIKNGQHNDAEAVMKTLFNASQYIGQGLNRLNWLELLKAYSITNHDAIMAEKYGAEFKAAKDSIDGFAQQTQRRDFGQEFENRLQKATNELLVKENQIKTFQLTLVILLCLMATGIAFFIWYNLRRTARHVKQLKDLNQKIAAQNNDLFNMFGSLEQSHNENTMVMRMVAHDLKNPIGGINSLVFRLLKKNDQPADMQEALELIYTTCKNSLSFINDLLKDKRPV
ncbi:MAG: tetratricopeptide repeat protein [Agriterribacter sp.]